VAQPLIDPFDRQVKDLRISITDRCNFRCTYCMPAEGMEWMDRAELLTYEEQARIARVCVDRFGFGAIRVTGGEPTLRAHLARFFTMLAPLGADLAMTTNGVRLPELAHDLADAGLRRVNISLDTLRPDTFRELTRRDELHRVLAGVDAALEAGLDPVKIGRRRGALAAPRFERLRQSQDERRRLRRSGTRHPRRESAQAEGAGPRRARRPRRVRRLPSDPPRRAKRHLRRRQRESQGRSRGGLLICHPRAQFFIRPRVIARCVYGARANFITSPRDRANAAGGGSVAGGSDKIWYGSVNAKRPRSTRK
jgi:hypothetical protein